MRHLFWKFFIVVWLTMTTAMLTILVLNMVFDFLPPKRERHQMLERIGLDAAVLILSTKGIGPAEDFVEAMAKNADPLAITIRAVGSVADCVSTPKETNIRTVVFAGTCYRISAPAFGGSLFTDYITQFVPWLAALATSLGSAYWLARQLIGPIAELRRGLSSLAAGEFGSRMEQNSKRRRDEITALADDFNVTANRLEEMQRGQQRLFHDVSHELRSPLSRLQAATGVLRKNPARLEAMICRMDTEIERLDLLVEEILVLARLSTADRPLDRQTLDLLDLINNIVEDASFEAQDRGIKLQITGITTFIARVDGEMIYRAIENVVRNAIKYTEDETTVTLTTRSAGNNFILCVSDHGPGVSTSELAAIFEPFARASRDLSPRGHGLGLAITKQAMERHGGTVKASLNSAQGLDVTLVLPR